MKTPRYIVSQFDDITFIVIDQIEQREICICSGYDDREDAEERAGKIAKMLNASI
jgi:ribosomal protein L14E/L6E/L27E